MSSEWFDYMEPSLTTSLQGKQVQFTFIFDLIYLVSSHSKDPAYRPCGEDDQMP